jgi:hypothetical protein
MANRQGCWPQFFFFCVGLTVLMQPQISWSSVVGKFFHIHQTILISTV